MKQKNKFTKSKAIREKEKIKISPESALAKIKILKDQFYQDLGKQNIPDIDQSREILLEKIEEVLDKVDIPNKDLILERLELDKIIKEEKGNFWEW